MNIKFNEHKFVDYAFSADGVTPSDATLDASYAWLLENLENLHEYKFQDVTTMMQNAASLAYEQYELAYDGAREEHMEDMEDDEKAWIGSGRSPDSFKTRSFSRKLRFEDWRARSDYSVAKKYVWQRVKEAREQNRPANNKSATYYAITTHNPSGGWYILAEGHQRQEVESAGHSLITGNDMYADTYRKNLRVVTTTALKRYYGFNDESIWLERAEPSKLGFTSLIEEEE